MNKLESEDVLPQSHHIAYMSHKMTRNLHPHLLDFQWFFEYYEILDCYHLSIQNTIIIILFCYDSIKPINNFTYCFFCRCQVKHLPSIQALCTKSGASKVNISSFFIGFQSVINQRKKFQLDQNIGTIQEEEQKTCLFCPL